MIGDIAQLVERNIRIVEVVGSNPTVSTRHVGQVAEVEGSIPSWSTKALAGGALHLPAGRQVRIVEVAGSNPARSTKLYTYRI